MRPTTTPSASTSKSFSFHSPDGREAEARFRISWSMSAPAPRGCRAENCGGAERGKDRTENGVIRSPGEGCAEQRQGGEEDQVSRSLGVHSRSRLERGSDLA